MVELVDTLVSGTSAPKAWKFESSSGQIIFIVVREFIIYFKLYLIPAKTRTSESAPTGREVRCAGRAPRALEGGLEPRNRMLRGVRFESSSGHSKQPHP